MSDRRFTPLFSPETSTRPEEDAPFSPSRRKFLVSAGAGLAAMGAARLMKRALSSDLVEEITAPLHDTNPTERDTVALNGAHPSRPWTEGSRERVSHNRRDLEHIYAFLDDLARFEHRLQSTFRVMSHLDYLNASVAQRALLRALLDRSDLPHQLFNYAGVIIAHEDLYTYQTALRTFSMVGASGLVYQAFSDAARRDGRTISFERGPVYYSASVQDYLPQGQQIWPEDIDPRNAPPQEYQDIAGWGALLREHPGWAGERRNLLFRQLASHTGIMRLARAHHLPIVEYLSLLKAIYQERQPGLHSTDRVETLEQTGARLLELRDRFAERTILGPETDEIILFQGNNELNAPGVVNPHAFMHGLSDDPWDHILMALAIDRRRVQAYGTGPEHDAEGVRTRVLDAIARSHENTFISLDTHGEPLSLRVDEGAINGTVITSRALARALLTRVERTHDPRTLSKMTIIFGSCYSYNFHRNLLAECKELWNTSSTRFCDEENLIYPMMITGAQLDSVSLRYARQNALTVVLEKQLPSLRRTGRLTGQHLLDAQPEGYTRLIDLTFFAPEQSTEFGQNDYAPTRSTRTV